MKFAEAILSATRSLRVNGLRTVLTMLGIIIGVTAVVALLSIGEGVQNQIQSQIAAQGTNLVAVLPGSVNQGGVQSAGGAAATLSYEDAQAIADPRNVPDAVGVAAEYSRQGQVVYGSQNIAATIDGTEAPYARLRDVSPVVGRFIMEQDVKGTASVAVLGSTAATNLFGGIDPVGKTIRINQVAFRVVGVLAKKGGSGFGSADDMVFVPITTAQQKLFGSRLTGSGSRPVSFIDVQASSASTTDQVANDITRLLERRHRTGPDNQDFTVFTQSDIIGTFNQITSILTYFLTAIAGISLLVGGIGIMNIMLVSVTERTREIGIRKAVGAKRRDILLQFLIEAMFVSLSGGVVGVAIGVGVSQLVKLTNVIIPVVSIQSIVLALAFSAVVGLFFGIYPARRAARLNPIDALRYE